jgi:hypothetical protein
LHRHHRRRPPAVDCTRRRSTKIRTWLVDPERSSICCDVQGRVMVPTPQNRSSGTTSAGHATARGEANRSAYGGRWCRPLGLRHRAPRHERAD